MGSSCISRCLLALLGMAGPSRAQEGDVPAWIAELGSEDFLVRERATTRLIETGIDALPRLEAASASADGEVRSRVERIVRVVLGRHVERHADPRRAAPVTLDLKDARPREALEALRKQVPLVVDLDDRNVPDDFRVEEFRAAGVPLRQALEQFCERAELRVTRETHGRIRVSRPPRLSFDFRDVDVRVIFTMIERTCGVTLATADEIRGTVTVRIENEPWGDLLDRVVTHVGALARPAGEGRVLVRPLAESRGEVESRTFVLKHLFPARPAEGKADPWAELAMRAGLLLTRGASWRTVHGKMEARARSLVVTDRKEVLEAVRELVERMDRPSGD